MGFQRTIIISGGAGFIGSHVVRLFVTKYTDYRIINLDALTYAGNLENLKDIQHAPNYVFEKVNILDITELERVFSSYQPDGVIHLAAESHVDRSILSPLDFVYTNVVGTVNLLNAAKKQWSLQPSFDKLRATEDDNWYVGKLFYHVSTDEVYGALGETGYFTETTPYDPHSPYSASKASSLNPTIFFKAKSFSKRGMEYCTCPPPMPLRMGISCNNIFISRASQSVLK